MMDIHWVWINGALHSINEALEINAEFLYCTLYSPECPFPTYDTYENRCLIQDNRVYFWKDMTSAQQVLWELANLDNYPNKNNLQT